jgi:hypothetical protein
LLGAAGNAVWLGVHENSCLLCDLFSESMRKPEFVGLRCLRMEKERGG